MKWTNEQLREWDKQYKGRLNPRATFYCDTCNKSYGNPMNWLWDGSESEEKAAFTLLVDETTGQTDCVHYDDVEIPHAVYTQHMEILEEAGLIDGDEDGDYSRLGTDESA